MTIRPRIRVAVAVTSLFTTLAVPATPSAFGTVSSGTPDCYDSSVAGTVEERRLAGGPVPGEILARTGFDRHVAVFTHLLCRVRTERAATAIVVAQAELLWHAATRRTHHAQRAPALPPTDDRGLYWARISMAKALRQWAPAFDMTTERVSLIRRFEYASRGITSTHFAPGVRRVLVTGFDPFTLDRDIRIGNPSGANALSLDGTRWTVDGRPVQIETVVFPVRYADFDDGMVEDALRSHYRAGSQRADIVLTASQGRVGLFDIEVYNGRRRSVSSIGDNNNVQGGGTLTAPVVSPGMPPGPEWLTASLPNAAMAATDVVPFTTRVNTSVLEIPAGQTAPVRRPDGPTPGSIAVEGAGGGYLSNEVAYRNTLQRDMLHPRMPAGHLHVPVLQFGTGNTTEITDPAYETNRERIVNGAHAILRNGLTALGA